MFSVLLKGFVLGFAVAASPGPIFFLCLRRALVQGRLYGMLSGFGVASVDGCYAAVATLGVAAVTAVLAEARRPLAVIGGVLLFLLGASILLQRPKTGGEEAALTARGLAWAYASTAGATLANPATILSFAALAATLTGGSALVVVGVLAGSAAWWCVLVFGASWLRPHLTARVLRGISVFSGLAIVALSFAAAYSGFA